jgi:hypothetical protein
MLSSRARAVMGGRPTARAAAAAARPAARAPLALAAPLLLLFWLLALAAPAAGLDAPVAPFLGRPAAPCGRYANATVAGVVVQTAAGFAFSPAARPPGALAWGSFVDATATASNFGQLRVATAPGAPRSDQAFAAGFLEGYLTAERIAQHHANLRTYFVDARVGMNASLEEPMAWVRRQDSWLRRRCAAARAGGFPPGAGGAPAPSDTRAEPRRAGRAARARWWAAACLAVRQADGLATGYAAAAAAAAAKGGAADAAVPPLAAADLSFLQNNGDLYDLIDALDPSQRPSWSPYPGDSKTKPPSDADAARLFHRLALAGKCSGAVALTPGGGDLLVGHSTWDGYSANLRIYKHYDFAFSDESGGAPASGRGSRSGDEDFATGGLSFSSYPGEISSDDDFYITGAGLVIVGTTNKIFDDSLFKLLDHRSAPSWVRARAASWLAADGEGWTSAVAAHNSGTYNNAYFVVDTKRFVPGEKPLQRGLLWVAEQIPGRVAARDVTGALAEQSYWAAFNVPAFPEVYAASGYPDFVSKLERFGQRFSRSTHWLSPTAAPRARIFARDAPRVRSLPEMAALMRSNAWESDPLSEGHPIAAICGRGDLDPDFPEARGCYDSKVTSWRLALEERGAAAVGGPTRGAGGAALPAFSWARPGLADLPHAGQPNVLDFAFERQAPACGADPLGAALGDGTRRRRD